jgi:hypothetical protein
MMDKLRAGDYVLALNPLAGGVYADRVFFNLHLRDSSLYPLLDIHHTLGVLTVTPDHLLFAGGEYKAAHLVKPGDSIPAGEAKDAKQEERIVTNVTVLRVVPTSGRVVNPVTHSGLIIVAMHGADVDAGLVATTVSDSPGHSQLKMVQLPSFGKLASYLFPTAFQDSQLMEDALTVVADTSEQFPPAVGFCTMVVVDVLMGLGFIAWHSGMLLALCSILLAACASPLRSRKKKRVASP